jgi:hypothetical protein
MATLSITVFEGAGEVATGDPLQVDTVTISGVSAQSSVITGSGRKRRRVRLCADTACHVVWGENPTADSGHTFMGAENPEYFDIESGHKVAVIARTLP